MEETITIRREEYRTLIEGNEKLQVIKRLAAGTDSIYSSNILRIIGGLRNDRNESYENNVENEEQSVVDTEYKEVKEVKDEHPAENSAAAALFGGI